MKLPRKTLILAISAAILVIGTGSLVATHTIKLAAFAGSKHSVQPASKDAKAGLVIASSTPSPKPSASPSSTSTPVAKPKPSPSPSTRNLDFQDGPCKGIHAADDGCVNKAVGNFTVASMTLWPHSITCSGSTVAVTFDPMMVTRYYLAGGGGNAVLQVDYSDGTSSPVITLPFTSSTDIQSYPGLAHTFNSTSNPSYRVRLTSPNAITLSWSSLANSPQGGNCLASLPSPSPSPY